MKRKSPALLPLLLFCLLFVILPVLYVVILSFLVKDVTWGVRQEFTLENYKKIFDPVYLKTFAASLKIAFWTTLLSGLIGYPFGYLAARLPARRKKLLLFFLAVPFWTNGLIRIYGWMTLLRSNGIISKILVSIGLKPLEILYTTPAVVIGTVYALFPMMALAVYSSAQKLDFSLLEAAQDLGAGRWKSFFTISFPLTLPGLLSGFVFVFVPSVGLFFISDLLGGGKIMLVGNLIAAQLSRSRNLPFGAALSVVLMLLMLLIIALYRKISGTKDLEGLL